MYIHRWSFFILLAALLASCNGDDNAQGELEMYGSGEYNFTSYPPFAQKPVKCFYHIPENSGVSTPVFMAVHGAGRDGRALRNALVNSANQKNFILLVPQFSSEYFPGSNQFNLANIFSNGENPAETSTQPREDWTFQVFDPLFQDFKTRSGSAEARYDIFGHSAGAQLVHRFLQFEPDAGFNRLVTSAAGWYMLPDPEIQFPYGQALSPAADVEPQFYFERTVYVVVGESDTDPDSFNLRHTPEADAQGLNRVDRAQYFHERSSFIADSLSLNFLWQYHEAPETGHNSSAMADFAAGLLY
ncbi:MAG: hypothetical protein ABR572_09335 [Cryomorphaceae bacterium]|nr:hypothetical protein [Flavobacteriales bacterium]